MAVPWQPISERIICTYTIFRIDKVANGETFMQTIEKGLKFVLADLETQVNKPPTQKSSYQIFQLIVMDEFLNNGTMTARTAQARTIESNRISGDSFRFAALEPGMDDS